MRTIIRIKTLPKKVHNKSGSTKIIFIDRCALIFRDFCNCIQSAIQTKKSQMSWKKNWPPSLRSTEESIVNQNSFWVLSISYITNFWQTRKINSKVIRTLFLLLNLRQSRKCALIIRCLENYLSQRYVHWIIKVRNLFLPMNQRFFKFGNWFKTICLILWCPRWFNLFRGSFWSRKNNLLSKTR